MEKSALKPNSWTYNHVEVSGHNLESSQTGFLPISFTETVRGCVSLKKKKSPAKLQRWLWITRKKTLETLFWISSKNSASGWWAGGCKPTPFHSIYHHVKSCSVRSSWEGRYTPRISSVNYSYVLCDLDERSGSVSTFAVVLKLSGQGKVLGYWGESGE